MDIYGGEFMITLREITKDNFWDCIELTVAKHQEDLIIPNAISIAQSKVQPECIPLGIYHYDVMVGFLMYCLDIDDQEYWIYRLMIDQKYQNLGYATKALEQVIELIKEDKTHNKIFIGAHRDGEAAIHLYQNFGFKFNGQIFGHEHIMVLEY